MGIGRAIALGGLGEGLIGGAQALSRARKEDELLQHQQFMEGMAEKRAQAGEQRDQGNFRLGVQRAGGTIGALDPRYYNPDGSVKSANGNGSVGALVGSSTATSQPSEHDYRRPLRKAGKVGEENLWLPADGLTPDQMAANEDRDALREQNRQLAEENRLSREQIAAEGRQLRESIAAMVRGGGRGAGGMTPYQEQTAKRQDRNQAIQNYRSAATSARTELNQNKPPKKADYEGYDRTVNKWSGNAPDSATYNEDLQNQRMRNQQLQRDEAMNRYSADSTVAAGQFERQHPEEEADQNPDFIVQQGQRKISTARVLLAQAEREAHGDQALIAEARQHYVAIRDGVFAATPRELWPRLKK